MGYAGNILPRHLAALGAEVHYITMDLPHYFQSSEITKTYEGFEGLSVVAPGTVEQYEGFYLHGLGHRKVFGQMRYVGLATKLAEIKPDVVQSLTAIGWLALDGALLKHARGYRLFTANHTTASVFPLANQKTRFWHPSRLKNLVMRYAPGRYISWRSELCYAATVDCADVARRFFGVQDHKIRIVPLGVDTDLFHPIFSEADRAERICIRRSLGFRDTEIVCIYTGQFTEGKNPRLLARAIAQLRKSGRAFAGLFFGNGAQRDEIKGCDGCLVHSFVAHRELPAYYRAADIGVWPTQESTSMLDAAACGLPIVVNDTLKAVERIEGNGVQYRLNDLNDLVRVLGELADPGLRVRLGTAGAGKMASRFAWKELIRQRLADFEQIAVSGARNGKGKTS